MIRSGEGEEEDGQAEGGERKGGEAAAGPVSERLPPPLPPGRAPRPRRLRAEERARPLRRHPRSPALPRRAPAAPPAPGGGGRALRPCGDPRKPTPARPGLGLSPSFHGSAPADGRQPGCARPRV